ncbi:unnamed protein product [Pleuronectes platessa]|uniref:Uncharacterized protein n=1 Tax=Pleuronectes platessa TaxID=8262 RepID=A0A9N7TQ20_PLEPL|nr:unnamed protein product [Pleuronectes platessa]
MAGDSDHGKPLFTRRSHCCSAFVVYMAHEGEGLRGGKWTVSPEGKGVLDLTQIHKDFGTKGSDEDLAESSLPLCLLTMKAAVWFHKPIFSSPLWALSASQGLSLSNQLAI